MQNPFTTAFSKAPEYTYISTDEAQEIIENFSYDRPTESVYKITGVRGSGKTVSLSKVEEELSGPDYQEDGWLVYRLTPSRDIVQQFAAKLYKESFIKGKKKNTNISINAQVLGTLYFRKKEDEDLDEILTKLKAELFAYSYEKIWEELSEGDRNLVKCILDKDEYKRAEVLESMGRAANNYSIYRDRLKKKGVIETRQGYLSLALPYFNEYVKEYC